MKHVMFALLTAVVVAGVAPRESHALEAALTPGQNAAHPGMRVFDTVRPPTGYLSFCRRHRAECAARAPVVTPRPLTARRWEELEAINMTVNATVEPVTDLDLHNTVEYWTYPDGRGDCEDYVLAKRRMLMERGWPASALLITVVRDEENLGHAVLTVVTDRGDFILDNKTSDIRQWRDTPYRFQKRQSRSDPLGWVSLDGEDGLRLAPSDPVAAR